MMVRRKKRDLSLLIVSSATVLILAMLAGAVFFLLPKLTAASTNRSMVMTRQTGNAAPMTNTSANTGKANKVVAQPAQAATTGAKAGSQSTAMGSGNTPKPAPATTANNGNQAAAPAATSSQNLTVPVVVLKQYVPNIRHTVAQSLNITDKALAQDLQSGMHLTGIATQHGLSNAQLQTLLSSSITSGFQPAISAGSLTQAQVSSFIQQTQQNPTTLEQQLSILPPAVAHW